LTKTEHSVQKNKRYLGQIDANPTAGNNLMRERKTKITLGKGTLKYA
jgi:hypothetical protein